jgi:hypothetical protein
MAQTTTQPLPHKEKTMSKRTLTRLGFPLVLLLLLVFWSNQVVRADEIAVWNFNDSDLLVDHGSGTLSTNFNLVNVVFTLGGTTTNARFADAAGQSLTLQGGTATSNNGRFLNLDVSTVGFSGVRVSFATQGTGTGFNNNQLQYSLDGVTFVNFGPPYSPTVTFSLVTFDLSSIVGLNNNPNAAFRIVFSGAASASGNNRIDNLVVEGTNLVTAVPEPSSMILFSLGLGGALVRKLKRRGWITIRE